MNAHSYRAVTGVFCKSALLAAMLVLFAAPHARAQGGCDNDGCAPPPDAPEIGIADLSPLLSSAALLGGSVLVLRGRRRRS